MSDIDWSKAPADATHYKSADGGYVQHWIKTGSDGRRMFMRFEDKGWWHDDFSPADISMCVERPAPWGGEGLPPVGTVCEWHGANSDGPDGWVYTESKVIAYTEDNLFVVMRKDGCWPVVERVDNCGFRPIKTPEQIAAEERETAIMQMQRDTCTSTCYDIFADLYDAGYRKPKPE